MPENVFYQNKVFTVFFFLVSRLGSNWQQFKKWDKKGESFIFESMHLLCKSS